MLCGGAEGVLHPPTLIHTTLEHARPLPRLFPPCSQGLDDPATRLGAAQLVTAFAPQAAKGDHAEAFEEHIPQLIHVGAGGGGRLGGGTGSGGLGGNRCARA